MADSTACAAEHITTLLFTVGGKGVPDGPPTAVRGSGGRQPLLLPLEPLLQRDKASLLLLNLLQLLVSVLKQQSRMLLHSGVVVIIRG